jgi:site-specific recombinase XerD
MNKVVKLQEAYQQFKNHLELNRKAKATILAYGKDIDQLIAFLTELKKEHIHEITSKDIEAFLAKLKEKGYSTKTLSRKLNSTRTFYRFLRIQEYVTDDPSLLVPHPKYEITPPRILSQLEYRALRDAVAHDPRLYAIIELLLQTGIRIGELTNLRLSDVKEDKLVIRAYEKHEEREVPLNRRAKEALKQYLAVRGNANSDFLFVTKTGRQFLVRNIRAAIERYFRKAGIENAKVNDLRHTFLAHHLKRGVSVVLLSKILGHKKLSSTERYLQFLGEKGGNSTTLSEL